MVHIPKPRVFKHPEVLRRMLIMRLQGWPLNALAFYFDCDLTSVRKACIRNGLPTRVVLLTIPTVTFIRDYGQEKLNPGKTYREYLEEERLRQVKARIQRCKLEQYGTDRQG